MPAAEEAIWGSDDNQLIKVARNVRRETISDANRVYPGDGVAPLTQILRDLFATGFAGALSLELFNRTYWEQDAVTVARTGLEKMKAAIAAVT